MTKSQKTATYYGITLSGSELKEFNRRYRERFGKKSTLCSKLLTILAALLMAAASIWLLVANVSMVPLMVLLMIPPAAGIIMTILSLFEKNEVIREQLQVFQACAMFLVMLNSFIFCRNKEDVFLYLAFSAITVIMAFIGVRRWGKVWMKLLKSKSESSGKKNNFTPIFLISMCVLPVVRALSNQETIMFVLVIIFFSLMCALLGYAMGICIGNVRYMRFINIQ